jgi:hypothetical protein
MHPIRLAVAGAAALLLAARPSLAQVPRPMPIAEPTPGRVSFGLDGVLMNARGSFGRNVDQLGYGIGGHALMRVDPRGILSLRAELATAQYGSEHTDIAYSPYFGGRVGLEVNTRNAVSWVGIGPELTIPLGRVRPYVNGSINYARFSTVSDLKGDGYDQNGNYQSNQTLASSQNQHDGTSARALGAGIHVPVGPRRWLTDAHLGVRYFDGGEADYLREGSITDNSDGSISFTPLRSRTPFVSYQLGVSVAVPRRSIRR